MSKATRPNGLVRKSLPITAIVFLALPIAGCGDELDCSAEETRKLIHQIAEKRFRDAFTLPADWSSPDLKFSLADIITREKGKNKATCAAKLHMAAPADPDGRSFLVPTKPVVEQDFDITYQLERTDEGRLYARVEGL